MLTLNRLRTLVAECDAITQTQVLGFKTALNIQSLSELAKKRIDYEKGFTQLINETANELDKFLKGSKAQQGDELSVAAFRQSEIGQQLLSREVDLWMKEVDDFDFQPVEISADDSYSERFPKESINITFKGYVHTVKPYMSLHGLISEGFFKLKEE